MKMKSENKIIIAICLFTVLLFTVSLLVSGHSITSVQHRDRSAPSGGTDQPCGRSSGRFSCIRQRGAGIVFFCGQRTEP